METKRITATTLYDYSLEVQQAALEGWRVSDKVEHFPTILGVGLLEAIMVKEVAPEVVVEEKAEEVKEEPSSPNTRQRIKRN